MPMHAYNRREFLLATVGATLLPAAELSGRPRIGLVRSNNPSLARFYKSFGSKEIIYQRVMINRLPAVARLAYRLVRAMR